MSSETFWYFAIGSMMHPESMQNRNVVSLKSVAGEIQHHKIHFFSNLGFAEAIHVSTGETFHGVLHRVDEFTMKQLDKVELGYTRTAAKARRYDTNEIIDCHVYTRDPNQNRGSHIDRPPQQRYKEIMIAGAEYYGLDADYTAFLKNHPHQPRTPPSEFKSIGEVPEGSPTITLDQLHEMNAADAADVGSRDSVPPLFFTVNGKVLKCIAADRSADDFSKRVLLPPGSPIWDLSVVKLLYDIKYGAPEKLEDFTHEHGAYVEHLLAEGMEGPSPFMGSKQIWQIYGHLDRAWKE